MRILCVGGGSGGHLTPIVAVVREIRKGLPASEVLLLTDRKSLGRARKLFSPLGVRVAAVAAGKFRRYANLRWYWHFEHIFKSYLPNLIDLFKVAAGFLQSLFVILRWRPDVVFAKGGFVSLPVGLAAGLLKKPLVLHDSDAAPGLANKILSRYATKIATGLPVVAKAYGEKAEFVGIPVDSALRAKRLSHKPLRLLVIGGSQGATFLNDLVLNVIHPQLKKQLETILVAGERLARLGKEAKGEGLQVLPFTTGEPWRRLLQDADIVLTRAGATVIAEMAALAKPTIIVPSPYLAGDHQSKNAEILQRKKAAVVLSQEDLTRQPEKIVEVLEKLLQDQKYRSQLGQNLGKLAQKNSARQMARMIEEVGGETKS